MFKILFQNKFLLDGNQSYLFFNFEIDFIKGDSNFLPEFLYEEFLQGKMSTSK